MAQRGHKLKQPEHCITYYQNQIGNGDPYFSSNYTILRGFGFFSNLRRYAMPLMIRAGKYFVKRLLTSNHRVVEDVSEGKSFRDVVRYQIRQSGREITTDILRKLRGGGIHFLFHSESSQNNFFRVGLFYKGTIGAFDDTHLATTEKNLGLTQRFEHVKGGKTFVKCGMLHID
ncbi:uncharacterized protein NPIL_52111 [Nephila pilipes]|uniref:Uncharacterized protein n=1 Tax=Nephila pilipes TaxID=299642 RepID=A0A8X6TMV3_NEPPI|nr:uncharacterized protein NPIL_52111 [Nephila pilipes]